MSSRTLCSVLLGVAGTVTSLVANAQPAEPAPVATAGPAAAAAPASKMRIGLNVVPMPIGTLKTTGGSGDLTFAFGLLPFFDYAVHPNFFVGFSPQYTFNVKAKDSTGSSGSLLDLSLRLGGGAPVADKIQLYGYLAPGYAIGFPPSGGEKSKGFALSFHGGATMDLSPTMFVNGEIGYRLGFEKTSFGGQDIDTKLNYLQIGLGGGMRL